MSRRSPLPYHWLAEYYDRFFAELRAPLAEARRHVLERILGRITSVCDLACGTGATADEFACRGLDTYAVDASPAMCRLARERAERGGLRVLVRRGDMRAFRLPKPVDLVTCEGDALNHVPRKADLQRVARAVARALKPGGYFFFDVNNRKGFDRYWSTTFCMEEPGALLVFRSDHTPGADRAVIDVSLFVREGDMWRRRDERVAEVCWADGEIRDALAGAGFDRVRAWDAARFYPASSLVRRGCRSVYLARKAVG